MKSLYFSVHKLKQQTQNDVNCTCMAAKAIAMPIYVIMEDNKKQIVEWTKLIPSLKFIYLFNLYKNHNYMAAPQSDPGTLSAFEASKRLTIIKFTK